MSRNVFLTSTLRGFSKALSNALMSEHVSAQPGVLQKFDPRVRVIGLCVLVLAAVICHHLLSIGSIFALALVLAVASRISVGSLAKRVWWIVLAFTGLIALPAVFITPGEPLLALPWSLAITSQGLRSAVLLILRVETAATLTTVLVLTTPWTQILKSLRSMGLPGEVITMLAMTHRYVFLLMETANQMFESRQSRTVGTLSGQQQRALASRTAGVLLNKSMDLSYDVYLAMMSRGFRGDIRLLTDFRMRSRDYVGLLAFILIGVAAVWTGR